MRRTLGSRLTLLENGPLAPPLRHVEFWHALWKALAEAGDWRPRKETPSEAAARALGLSSSRELRQMLRDDVAGFKRRVLSVKGLADRIAVSTN